MASTPPDFSLETTATGARVAVYRSPAGSIPVFVVGGLGGRSVADTPMRPILDQLANHGVAYSIVDPAGAGRSPYLPPITVERWLSDIGEIYERDAAGPKLWIGVSIGAWLMLLLHREHPEWFRAMCAVAPAVDWDATYLLPGVASGRFADVGDGIRIEHGVLPKSLVDSMASHHLLGRPLEIRSPLHCIYGAVDDIAPPAAVERLISQVRGATCTLRRVAGEGHEIAKFATSASQRAIAEWLTASGTPISPGSS